MKKLSLAILICTVLLLAFPASGIAHPADMYYHTHTVLLNAEGLQVTWEMMPGPMIAQSIWFAADQDQDDIVSDDEAMDWVEGILGTFSAEIDQQPLGLALDGLRWPSSVNALYKGEEPIQIFLSAAWPVSLEEDRLIALHNRFSAKSSLSWFEVLAENGITFEVPGQNSGTLRVLAGFEGQGDRITGWESGSPSIPWVVESVGLGGLAEEAAAESQASAAAGSGPATILEGLIRRQEGSFTFLLGALALAALLGALHALSPGHGKTIVAAYLVGSQGKAYHAVALGAIVTLTHTGSVFALGIITLTASRYFLAADIFPALELISGLLIFILGLGLLWPRLRLLVKEARERRAFRSGRDVEASEGNDGANRLLINQPIQELGPPHSHDPSDLGAVPRGPSSGSPLENISWRSLVPLAISGGLVPCPDAIAILLVSATINRIAFGLSLILSFSLGLAAVLILIGLLIVQGKKLFERLRWFNKAALVMPVLSAVIVLVAGLVLSISALKNISGPGNENNAWRQPGGGAESLLSEASILYTALDENQKSQLMMIPAEGGTSRPISENLNIWNFAVAPGGNKVVFAADNDANGTRIYSWGPGQGEQSLLLECENAYCSELAWSPDGQGLLYSRLDFDSETNPANVQSIWWLDVDTLETAPLFQDALTPGFSPRWSPDGKWLSYTSINPLEAKFFNIETGESQTLPSGLGYPAVWSPDSTAVILQDIEWGEYGYLNKLYNYSLAEEWLTMLGYEEMYDDSFPAWSPDGQWLAVVRRAWNDGMPVSENQIWIMRPDGTEARQLTESEKHTYGQPSWSADSRFLVFDFRVITEDRVRSGAMLLDLQSGIVQILAEPGSRPAWLLEN